MARHIFVCINDGSMASSRSPLRLRKSPKRLERAMAGEETVVKRKSYAITMGNSPKNEDSKKLDYVAALNYSS